MGWLGNLLGGSADSNSGEAEAAAARLTEWEEALQSGGLPSFVEARLEAAASGKTPWLSTMTPVELAMVRRHGIRPVAMVSGTCWYHYGYSWTRGHAAGWHAALKRMSAEALAAGAHAIVDVKLRTIDLDVGESMDFTVIGTAVCIDGLPKTNDPVIATVPALEFARLLRSGIVPTGIAIGAQYDIWAPIANVTGTGLFSSWQNQPLRELSQFWEGIRRSALAELEDDARQKGDGVLAHTHFGQLLKIEREKRPAQFLGRHIVVGTVIHDRRSATNAPIEVRTVVDMRDDESPLLSPRPQGHNAYPADDEEDGPI
jgi:uncharacterized protein YbjQ (UPF0145 family)